MRCTVRIEALAVNAVVAVAITIGVEVILVTALPCDHETAILERGDRRIFLIIIRLRINLERITRLLAIHIKALAVDTVIRTIPLRRVCCRPGCDKAAVLKTRNRRLGRSVARIHNDELAARRRAVRIKPLAAKVVIVAAVPSCDKTAVLKRRHRHTVLSGVGQGIDLELITNGVAAGVITLAIDTPARAVLATIIAPHHHHAAVIQRRR